jgi:adenosylmethionine-8-amino-7-oxononanoate aminotransferase
VEVALKMTLQFWHNKGILHKRKIIAFDNAYHGDTFGAMSAGARSAFNAAFNPLLFEVHHIPVPNENNIDSVQSQFLQLANEDNIAAFIFEPLVQGAGGMLMHQPKYLDQLLAAAKQKNILCIADEVMTGFGRTGKNFAVNYLQNQPDIICLSKGITGGFMPLGVTACSQKIYDAFYADEMEKTFFTDTPTRPIHWPARPPMPV